MAATWHAGEMSLTPVYEWKLTFYELRMTMNILGRTLCTVCKSTIPWVDPGFLKL